MTDSVLSLGQALITGIWSMFGITVPGFTFSFGELWLGVAICSVSLLLLKLLFGIGGRSGGGSRTGSTNNPKISKERRNDEF